MTGVPASVLTFRVPRNFARHSFASLIPLHGAGLLQNIVPTVQKASQTQAIHHPSAGSPYNPNHPWHNTARTPRSPDPVAAPQPPALPHGDVSGLAPLLPFCLRQPLAPAQSPQAAPSALLWPWLSALDTSASKPSSLLSWLQPSPGGFPLPISARAHSQAALTCAFLTHQVALPSGAKVPSFKPNRCELMNHKCIDLAPS